MREFGENPLQMIFPLEELGNGKAGKFYSRDLWIESLNWKLISHSLYT